MSDAPRPTSAALRYQGTLGVVSGCAVLLHLVYGRVFVISLLPPFARAVTALAGIGVALGGLLALILRDRFTGGGNRRLAGWVAAFGFAAPFCQLMVVEHVPVEQTLGVMGMATLAAASVLLAVPFVLAGAIATATMLAHPRDLARLWATTLVGASVGAVVALPCLRFLPANVVALVAGGVACWLALLLAADADAPMRGPIAAGVAVLLLGVLAATQDVFRFYHVRAWNSQYTEDVAWTVSSRVGVFPPAAGTTAIKTLPLPKRADGYASAGAPDFKWLDVDGAGWTPMLRFDGDLTHVQFLLDSVVYAAHRLQHDARVLIVGVGGGRDVLAARAAGQREIVGIEQNPGVWDVVTERFRFYSGQPYALDGVNVMLGSPRRLLPRLAGGFDVVQLGTSTAGTLLPFLEDEGYLFTREAFREYFRLLTPPGVLTLTRHFTPQNPLEVLRVLATVRDAWGAEGVADPARHVVVLGQEFSATILARREPFGPAELAVIDRLVAETGMTLLFDPRKATAETTDAILLVGPAAGQFDPARFDVRATSDDWPFFTQFFRSPTAEITPDPFGLLTRNQAAFALVSLLAIVGVLLALACLAGALVARAPAGGRTPLPLLVYFFASGYAAVALVMPLLERLRVLAGSDAIAVAVGAVALGLAGAAGSVTSDRLGTRGASSVAGVLGGAAVVLALWLPRLGAGASVGNTVLLALGLLPLGALMGAVVPLGVGVGSREARTVAAGLTAHAAGACAALATLLAVAMRLGMGGVVATATIGYAVAAASALGRSQPAAPEAEAAPTVAVGA